MKRAITTIILCLQALLMAAQIPASSDLISYSGRIQSRDWGVSFDWSGVTVHVKFKGSQLRMNCSDTGCDYFNVWIDKTPGPLEDTVLEVKGDNTDLRICSGLKKGEHDVYLQKRTEGEQGCVTIESFYTDGQILRAANTRKRRIEFIGDSYTCGYGTEGMNREQPFRAREENCNRTYAAILGRYFDAEINLVCHSGRGISRNYDDGDADNTMVARYDRTFDENPDVKWSARLAGYNPDIVVIYLGTNDFSTGKQPTMERWCSDYAKLIGKVRTNYGNDVPILCVASRASEMMGSYVAEAVRRCGDDNVSWTAIQQSVHNDTTELGSSWHPNYTGQRKVAFCIAPYISTLTNWSLPFKALE